MTIALGIVGALLGGWIGRVVGLYHEGEAAGFVMAVIGAVIVLALYRLVVPLPADALSVGEAGSLVGSPPPRADRGTGSTAAPSIDR